MYLKRLDILGFKSLPNKTTVKFAEGMTAIVGPNGCGKTNILDALRWVLGEQKPTLLRGGKMEEVIFNGTRDLKPLGMAEVTLTVINDRGVLPVEYNEVQISRRLFRSGESEYLLNKVPCRLRDILDLFVDTGMGAHSYSVIQQDMIEAVISDKAEERRFLFEEAAGITKYKHRKRAALRKLDATDQDILRLKDIYSEVKTRVNSLYRQHKKAERYRHLRDEIKDWDLYLNGQRVRNLAQEKRELQAQKDRLSDQKLSHQTSLDRATAQLEEDRKQLLDIEREVSQASNEIYQITERAHGFEREISVLNEKRANAQALIEKNGADIVQHNQRCQTLTAERDQTTVALESARAELAQVSEELQKAQQNQAEADRRLLEARQSRESEQQKLLELEGRLSSGKAEESGLKEQETELSALMADLSAQAERSRNRQAELLIELSKRREAVDHLTERKAHAESRRKTLHERMDELVELSESLNVEQANKKAAIEASEARRRLLEEMILQYEGHETGVVAAMEVRDQFPGIAGTVAELFVPEDGMEVPLQAALGEAAKWLICRDRQTAEQVIQFVRSENKGRVGILVPESGTITPAVKRPEIKAAGIIGWLDAFVGTTEQLRPLMQAVLSRTLIFDESANVDEILSRLPYGFLAVSTTGQVYGSNVIAGGSDDRYPLFRRREKVEEERDSIEQLRVELQETTKERNRVTGELAAVRAETATLTEEMDSLTESMEAARSAFDAIDFEQRSLAGELNRLDKERRSAGEKLERIQNRQYSLGLNHDELAVQKESMVSSMDEVGNHLNDRELAAGKAQEAVSRLQVTAVEGRSKVTQLESRLKHLEELDHELKRTIDVKAREIERARTEVSEALERIGVLETQLKVTFEERDSKTAGQKGLRERQSALQDRVSQQERQIKTVRDDRDDVNENLHKLDMRMAGISSEIEGVREKINDEYDIDISSITPVRPEDSMTDEEARVHLGQTKEKLKKFGAVNLLALEEYEEASEREKFLREQLDDLTTAKSDLEATILKINQTARELFQETFAKVQENFQRLFVELFTGGEANIQLVDPSDPLESDIDISARPRGKKLLSITMMSGGERALTAISLLFALYLVKPSPFCILDEIDAPLDDANCRRFLNIIRSFSGQTQFIIITHNKITMEAADNLYGITMEQPGVSKLVAVRFHDDGNGAGEEGGAASTVTLYRGPEDGDDEQLPAAIRSRVATELPVQTEGDE